MNRGKQHMDEELLIRFILGESSEKEAVKVRAWIDFSDENRKVFQDLQKIWSSSAEMRSTTPADVNVDAAWENLKTRIDQYKEIEHKFQGKQRSLSFYLTRVAAVLVVGLLIYSIYNYQSQQHYQVQLVSADSTSTDNPLPDGSIISLNENTSIAYQKDFSSRERRVTMTGEAFFKVKPDTTRPFIIEAQNAIITVLGTSFNVKALADEAAVEVLVEEGLVELANSNKSQSTHLHIGEKGIFLKESNAVMKETDIDIESLYWLNKTLLFRDTDLSVVFETLERLYKVNIEVQNDQILHCQLTAKFSNETIDNIIDHISTIFELTIKTEANKIVINGKGCQ